MKIFLRTCIVVLIVGVVSVDYSVAQVPELILNKQFQKDAQTAIHSLYNFKFRQADKQLASWKEKYPRDPVWMLIDGVKLWWEIISDLHNTSCDEKFIRMMKKTDYAAAQVLYKQPGNADALLVRMAANGYIARIYADRDEWIKSLQAAHKAYKLYDVLKENTPDLPDIKMIDGLKLYYSAYLPEAYPIIKAVSAFLPDGNEAKGIEYLKYASKHAIFVQAEAMYFLGNISYEYEHQYSEAVHYFKVLYNEYPRNNYYARLFVKSLYKMGKFNEALSVANEALKRWKEKGYPYGKILKSELWYWQASVLYRNHENDQALGSFKRSLNATQKLSRYRYRETYVAAAYFSGVILARKGESKKAVHYFELVQKAKTGKDYKSLADEELGKLES